MLCLTSHTDSISSVQQNKEKSYANKEENVMPSVLKQKQAAQTYNKIIQR